MLTRKQVNLDGTFGGNFPYEIDYQILPENIIEIDEEIAREIDLNLDKYRYQNGNIVDISDTQEYQDKLLLSENVSKKADLQLQIEEIDLKRIRAIAEPELKDAENGLTWLEYYTQQIQELREQIANL